MGAIASVGDNGSVKNMLKRHQLVSRRLKDVRQCKENYKGTLGNVMKPPREIGFF